MYAMAALALGAEVSTSEGRTGEVLAANVGAATLGEYARLTEAKLLPTPQL